MFLTSIGPNGNAILPKSEGAASDDKNPEFTKKLLEKAGIKLDDSEKMDTADTGKPSRSMSPEIAEHPTLTEKTIVAKAAASEWEV